MREDDWRIHSLMGNDLTGWEWEHSSFGNDNDPYCHVTKWNGSDFEYQDIPYYSTTWEGAGLVMEWLRTRDIYFGLSLSIFHHGWYQASVEINRVRKTEYDASAPLALAKAYIAAMEERDNG